MAMPANVIASQRLQVSLAIGLGLVNALLLWLLLRSPAGLPAVDPSLGQAAAKPKPAPEQNTGTPPAAAAPAEVQPVARAAGQALPDTAVLLGRVTNTKDQPVRCLLSLFAGDETKALADIWTDPSRTDYAVPGLAPGRYRLWCKTEGYRQLTLPFEVPAGTALVRQDVRLQPSWQLRVLIVTPDGRPMRESLQGLRKDNPALWRFEVTAMATVDPPPATFPVTDNNQADGGIGRWYGMDGMPMREGPKLPKRFAGYLELPEDRELYVSAVMRIVVLATERVAAGQEVVTLTVPFEEVLATFGTVRMQIVDEDGKPVSDARVGLSDAQSSGQGQPVDAEGRIELRQQRPGLLNVDVQAPGRSAVMCNVEVAPGGLVDIGAVRVARSFELKARMEGAPADQEVSVSLSCIDAMSHPALRPRTAYYGGARKDGRFEASIAPGRYLLRATAGWFIAYVEFDTKALGSEPLVVPLRAAARLKVIPPPAGRGVELAVLDSAGRSYWRRPVSWAQPGELPFPPGDYVAEIRRADGSRERRAIHLPASGAELDLR